ncbi:MAG: hypothetical protein OEM28_08520 [Nitrosopumilus sp.]|nr:hypothetical protein [Nitrosopumilus sp.]MDH3487894.1 hypothetical protein [Nitrosopumilus sp.]
MSILPKTTTGDKILIGVAIGLLVALPGVSFQLYDLITDPSKFDKLEKQIDYSLENLKNCNMNNEEMKKVNGHLSDAKNLLIIFDDYDKAKEVFGKSKIEMVKCFDDKYYYAKTVTGPAEIITEEDLPESRQKIEDNTIIFLSVIVALMIVLLTATIAKLSLKMKSHKSEFH